MENYNESIVESLIADLMHEGYTENDLCHFMTYYSKPLLGCLRGTSDFMFSRKVVIDKSLSLQQALEKIKNGVVYDSAVHGNVFYDGFDYDESMPRVDADEVEVFFFKVDHPISCDDLAEEYELRGLEPCYPITLAQINCDDQSFVWKCSNCTQWGKGKKGTWLSIQFLDTCGGFDEKGIFVNDHGLGYHDSNLWFAGVRKERVKKAKVVGRISQKDLRERTR